MEVYERPANRFVAGFFGTPAMNFFAGRVKFNGDIPSFVIGNDTITLSQRLKTILAAYCNKEMVMGIRPENLSLRKLSAQVSNVISASVDVIEPLGNRIDIYLTGNGGMKFIVNADTHIKINIHDVLKVHVDCEKLHIFEPGKAGKNIPFTHST